MFKYTKYNKLYLWYNLIVAKVRKWGNSIGLLVPKKEAEKMGLRENQDVSVEIIVKTNPLKELFGSLKFSKSTKQLLKEARENESKFL